MERINKFDQASATFLGLAQYYNIAQDESNTNSKVVNSKNEELLEEMKILQNNIQDVSTQIHKASMESAEQNISFLLGKVEGFVTQLEQDLAYIEKNKETIPVAIATMADKEQQGEAKLETKNPELVASLLRSLSDAISTLAGDSSSLAAANINWDEVLQQIDAAENTSALECMRKCLQLLRPAVAGEIRDV